MGFESNHASDVQNLDVFVAESALLAHFVFPLFFNNAVGEFLYPEIRQFTSYLNPAALLKQTGDEIQAAKESKQPFLGVLFTATTHLPFAASYPHNVRFVDPDYRGANRFQIDFDPDTFMQRGFREDLTEAERQHIIDLYDGTVSEFDELIGQCIDLLKKKGVYDNTIIVLMSDHGDDLYEEHTTLGHGTNFFGGDQSTRIPFLVRFPGGKYGGTRIPWITRTIDIAPTLLSEIGVPTPASYVGVDLTAQFTDPSQPLSLPAFAETCYLFFPKIGHPKGARTVKSSGETLWIDPKFRNNLVLRPEYHDAVIESKDRMIRTNRWKLIEIPGDEAPIYRLYDMVADPHQKNDLSLDQPEIFARLKDALHRWWAGETDLRWSAEDDVPR
jgi:arylsulfatase A-like enzyme